MTYQSLPLWAQELIPIMLLLVAIAVVIRRLPRIDVGHSQAFLRRRFFNWFPVGMTYAFLYMGRYNLNACKLALGEKVLSKADFGTIFFWGTLVYGISFIINGPLTDRLGGRTTILISATGTALMNIAMGSVLYFQWTRYLVPTFSILYAMNMYFQSFGAVSIVKVNASWFHLRERGAFGGIFGILIALGIYFAYDWGRFIIKNLPTYWVFFIPAAILTVFLLLDFWVVRDTPGEAGLLDFDTQDATEQEGPRLSIFQITKKMLQNPAILVIGAIEFCSGFLRNAIMQWYPIFTDAIGISSSFVSSHWGMLLCMAGILGGVVAGFISDHIFESRRGPVVVVLYGAMFIFAILGVFTLKTFALGWVMVLMSLCVIGVHGMLSGTASMDFGGRKNTGIAVGLIDGLVYLGTATQALILGHALPKESMAKSVHYWALWPLAMIPVAFVGSALAVLLWNAKPKPHASHS